jgi:hypothetical protein
MKNKIMTAVEWLVEQMKLDELFNADYFIKQAKEMEKEQIIDAASDHCYPTRELARIDAEQYYNETYNKDK